MSSTALGLPYDVVVSLVPETAGDATRVNISWCGGIFHGVEEHFIAPMIQSSNRRVWLNFPLLCDSGPDINRTTALLRGDKEVHRLQPRLLKPSPS